MSSTAAAGAQSGADSFSFEIDPSSEFGSSARSGVLTTPHGAIKVPGFLPVATRGAVRLLDWYDIERLGFDAVLLNSYHLMLRPGIDRIKATGGLHDFLAWNRPILTDSGGFQAMSLGGKATDEGIRFKSVYDGTEHLLTPETAIAVQRDLGVDLIVALDECPRLPAPRTRIENATYRSLGWARRSIEAFSSADSQLLIGVVQGGVEPDLRLKSAMEMAELGFGAYAIGGLSVGESFEERIAAMEATLEALPADRPRYLMGVGDPPTIVEAVWRGVDLFDSVLPTRLGRHGSALTWSGRLNLRGGLRDNGAQPIDDHCGCSTCARYSRAYLRHLLLVGEESGRRLVTVHNLYFLATFFDRLRHAISSNTLGALRQKIVSSWGRYR